MKIYRSLSLIAILFLPGLLHAQFKPGDVGFNSCEYEIFKAAKVKTQTQVQIDSANSDEEIMISVSSFSNEGRLEKIIYADNGEDSYEEEIDPEDTTALYEYEMAGHEPIDTMKDEYEYFPDGRIRKISLFGYDLYPIVCGFQYNKKNKLDSSFVAAAEARRYSYDYDKAGNIIKRIGKANMFQYDNEGNLMDGMVWVDYEESDYTWNDKHQLISELFYMQGEFYYRIDYTYDENGLLVTSKVFYDTEPNAIPAYSNYFFYNHNKLPDKMVTEEEGLKLAYKYVYTFY